WSRPPPREDSGRKIRAIPIPEDPPDKSFLAIPENSRLPRRSGFFAGPSGSSFSKSKLNRKSREVIDVTLGAGRYRTRFCPPAQLDAMVKSITLPVPMKLRVLPLFVALLC